MKTLSYIFKSLLKKPLILQPLPELISNIEDHRKDALLQIYNDYKHLMHHAPGSSGNHQSWNGGYADHIADILRINTSTYNAIERDIRPLPFSHASAAVTLFFHDIEKPFKYGPNDCDESSRWRTLSDKKSWESIKWNILEEMKETYNFTLSDDEVNALKYTHGEGNDYKKGLRIASPLAAHVHHCDNTSARIWYNKGKGLSL